MRVLVVFAFILATIASLVAPPAAALFNVGFMGGAPVNIGVPYVTYSGCPGFTYAMPFSQGSYMINEAHTSTLANTDTEALAIAFPELGAGGSLAISPEIAQTTSQTVAATTSYFFNDFLTST